MTMEHGKNELTKLGDGDLAKILDGVHDAFKKRHPKLSDISLPFVVAPVEKQATIAPEAVKIYPEISLEAEWTRQAQNLARLFAKELKFKTPEEYIATLPTFEPQPEEYKGRLDIPVIVETRISLKRALELADIPTYYDANLTKDWKKDKFNFETPKKPYTTWLNDGKINLNNSVSNVRTVLKDDERGGTAFDGVALYLRNPEIIEDHYLDLPGSQVGSGHAPRLLRWYGLPGLDLSFVDDAEPGDGSVVAGRKINA